MDHIVDCFYRLKMILSAYSTYFVDSVFIPLHRITHKFGTLSVLRTLYKRSLFLVNWPGLNTNATVFILKFRTCYVWEMIECFILWTVKMSTWSSNNLQIIWYSGVPKEKSISEFWRFRLVLKIIPYIANILSNRSMRTVKP